MRLKIYNEILGICPAKKYLQIPMIRKIGDGWLGVSRKLVDCCVATGIDAKTAPQGITAKVAEFPD